MRAKKTKSVCVHCSRKIWWEEVYGCWNHIKPKWDNGAAEYVYCFPRSDPFDVKSVAEPRVGEDQMPPEDIA
jgi:hypothetical protein